MSGGSTCPMAPSKNDPVDPRVRLAIAQWPDDAPRGAVTTFCVEYEISRKTFYAIRARAKTEGQAAALEPRSRRPKSSPGRVSEEIKAQAVGVRAALESSGLDHGPISVHDKMLALGMDPVPSVASLARIFREKGVARLEPRKKPRSAWRRFVYPAPNACWQIDATEYVLTGGRTCVIFQLIDDHSRYAVASHVAWGETAEAAVTVAKKAIAAHGVPQRLLSDNGAALNPSRRGWIGQLTRYLAKLGVADHHRPALQADHPGQERTVPPDPVPLARQAAPSPDSSRSCRLRSRRSTTSTTPRARTRGCPAGSPPHRHGKPPRRPSRHGRSHPVARSLSSPARRPPHQRRADLARHARRTPAQGPRRRHRRGPRRDLQDRRPPARAAGSTSVTTPRRSASTTPPPANSSSNTRSRHWASSTSATETHQDVAQPQTVTDVLRHKVSPMS